MATKPESKQMLESKRMKVTLVRSVINTRESHRATVRGLGLRHLNHTVEIEDTPATRGMVRKVAYLVKCED
jgi:large subunit ribosomal protein L30